MIDNEKITEIRENLKLDEKAFLGETPQGEYTVVKVATEPVSIGSDGAVWYPVDVRNADTKETFQMSLKGLLSAKGFEYSTRNNDDRIKMLFALEGTKRKFEYTGKETKIVKLKNRESLTIDGKTYHKGEDMPLKLYTFKSFKVG